MLRIKRAREEKENPFILFALAQRGSASEASPGESTEREASNKKAAR